MHEQPRKTPSFSSYQGVLLFFFLPVCALVDCESNSKLLFLFFCIYFAVLGSGCMVNNNNDIQVAQLAR